MHRLLKRCNRGYIHTQKGTQGDESYSNLIILTTNHDYFVSKLFIPEGHHLISMFVAHHSSEH